MQENIYNINKDLSLYKSRDNDMFIIESIKRESILDLEKEKYYLEKYIKNIDCKVDILNEHNVLFFKLANVKKLISLRDIKIQNNYELFFKIAINITKTLQEIHKNDIFHTNITYDSIYLDEKYNAYIFNFFNSIDYSDKSMGLSSIYFKNLPVLNKSPEQFGRINSEVDLRSDIYNLGLVFYELLENKHPFESDDDLQTLHLILTKNISSLENLPKNISELVVKLLKKEVSNRYQSTHGLLYDLIQLEDNYVKSFILGQKDISSRLQFPQKVYGRKKEINQLVKNYKNVCLSQKQTIFISGYSGVGKSSLIDELKNKIVNTNSYFISSKFDQYNKDLPYFAISEAFDILVKQILLKSDEEIESIKINILNALRGNGQILIDLIPSLQKIIGKQKEVEKLPSNESENRFNQIFVDFIKIIATKETPLVLVIDDLQWMDLATLKLLENIINEDELEYIFILSAYRSNEVENNFPLKNIIDNNKNIKILELEPLKKKSLRKFLRDSFFLTKEETQPLLDEIYTKTDANPFFFKQFIKKLYDEKLLYFSYDKFKWEYNIKKIRQENISDNVASLMKQNIQKVKKENLKYLQIASCLGANFDLKVIEKIDSLDIVSIIKKLKDSFTNGFLIPSSIDINNRADLLNSDEVNIKFLHDQVQQAIYSTIDEKDLLSLHYNIGRTLLDIKDIEIYCFEILNHLNFSKSLIKEKTEKFELINLNIKSYEIASASTAYDGALVYLDIAKELLEEFDLQENYKLYIDILLNYVELLYLTSDFEKAKKYEDILFSTITNIDDEIRLRRILTVQYTRIGKLDLAINEGLKSLKLLGMHISKDISFEDVGKEIQEVQELIKNKPFSKIAKLAKIEDEKVLKTLDILMEMQPCSYNSGSLIFPITILRLLKLTIKHGNSYLSYYIYMMYALMNTKVLKDYDMAFEASKWAQELKKDYDKSILTGRFNMMLSNFVMPWQNKLEESTKLRAKAYSECLEYGDYYWGIHSYIFGFYANLVSSKNLNELYYQTKTIANVSKKINQISQYYLCNIQMNLIDVLRGKLNNIEDLNHKDGFEQIALSEYDKQNYMCGKYDFIVARLLQGFMFGRYDKALDISLNEKLDERSLDEGIFHEAFYKVFNILSILALDFEGNLKDEIKKRRYYSYIDTNLSFIDIWKKSSPKLFLGVDYLIKAVKFSIDNSFEESVDAFESAIKEFKNNKFIFFEAISNEFYSKYWEKRGNKKISNLYLQEAIELYKEFKAYAKAEFLETKLSSVITNKTQNSEYLDLDLIIKSSNSISKDRKLKRIIKNILELVYKFSGAQNGFMFLNESELTIAAQINDSNFKYFMDEKFEIQLPISVVKYAQKLKEVLLINDINSCELEIKDSYIAKNEPKSILVIPLVLNDEVKAVIYLENFNQKNIFTKQSIETIKLLSTQMIISIENSYFYENLEGLVEKRTNELENTLSLFDMGQMLLFKWENKKDWPVSYLSNNIESILGYKKDDFLSGKINYIDIIHDDDKVTVLKEVKKASKGRENTVLHKTYRIKNKNGKYLWIYDSTKIVYDELGNVAYFLGYIVDVTKEKKRENYLLQQTKMIALGEMIGNIAHQWRQPLSLISTSASSLKLKRELKILEENDINESVEIILNTVNELSHTIDDFRDFLCVDKSVFEEFYLDDIVSKAQKMINHFFVNYNIRLNRKIPKNLKIKCSESQLTQVFINILSNSKDALLLNNVDKEKVIEIKAYEKSNKKYITIKDNAGGIDSKIIGKIFEPYFTTKHQSQGTGLGLYLTHQIITNELEGELEVHNEEMNFNDIVYKGACLTICLDE